MLDSEHMDRKAIDLLVTYIPTRGMDRLSEDSRKYVKYGFGYRII